MAQPGGLFSFGQTQPQLQQQQAGATPFSFGAKPAGVAPVSQGFGGGGFSFGSAAAPVQQQQQQQQPASAFSFGTPVAGQQQQQQQQQQPQAGGLFGFGTTPGASVAPGAATGFGFGAQAAQAPTQQAAPVTGFGFGTTPGASTLGAPATGLGSSFGFGTAPAAAAPAAATGFGFGAMAAAAPAPVAGTSNFGFGSAGAAPLQTAPASTAQVAPFSFGSKLGTAAPTAPAATGGFSFGTPTAGAAPAPATLTLGGLGTGGLFGTTATPAANPAAQTMGLGTGLFGNTPATSTAPTFGGGLFGSLATTTSTASTVPGMTAVPFSFGSKLGTPGLTAPAGAPAASTGFSFGGFGGLSTLGAPPATSLGGTMFSGVSTATATPSTGLGGVPKYATTGSESSFAFGGGSGDGKTENRAIQELPLPPEMLVLVDELKNHIKAEKSKFTELNRTNMDPIITKVSEEIEEIQNSGVALANLIHKQISNVEAIRALIHQGIRDAEMATQTHETPSGSQADHNTPMQYFFRVVETFKERMHTYLREIEKAENSLSYVLTSQNSFTAEELYASMQATRDAVIVLAAKVQVLHEEVVSVSETHRNLQRYLIGETAEFTISSAPGTPTPGTSGAVGHGKHVTFGKTTTQPYQSQPQTSYQFPNLLDKEKESDFSKISLLFPHKLVEPPKIAGMHLTSPTSLVKTSPPGMAAFSSTRMERPPAYSHKSTDSLIYPSHALFQTQQSTILSQTQMGSPNHPTSPGISLKRSKR